MKLNSVATKIQGVYVVETAPFVDARGSFSRLFCERELSAIIGERKIVQINHSTTKTPGTIRGMHYQTLPHCETKFVRCISGRVWDVVVDLRKNSETFLSWFAVELSQENSKMLVVPEGCAHGFQALEANSGLMYFVTAMYSKESERGVRFDETQVGIAWPLKAVSVSEKDMALPFLPSGFEGITTVE